MDGEHVVFGKVIQGMDTVYAIEGGAGTYSGKPRKKVVIADSGEIPKDKWDEETWTLPFFFLFCYFMLLYNVYEFFSCTDLDSSVRFTCIYAITAIIN